LWVLVFGKLYKEFKLRSFLVGPTLIRQLSASIKYNI